MKKFANYLVTIIILTAVLLFNACNNTEQNGANPTKTETKSVPVLRLAYRPKVLSDITPVIIKEANISRPGVKIELVAVSSPQDAFQKFSAGEVDAIAGAPLEPIFQNLADKASTFQGYYLQVDKGGEGWTAFIGSKKANITKMSDLAGKPVASVPVNQTQHLLKKIMIASGIPEAQVKVTSFNPATPLVGLESGEYVAMFCIDPISALAQKEGHNVLAKGPISHYLYQDRPLPVAASIISKKFVEANAEAYKDFLSIMDEAVNVAQKEPEKVHSFFEKAEYGGLSPEVSKLLSTPVMVKPDPSLKAITQEFVNDLVKDGVLKTQVDVSPLFP